MNKSEDAKSPDLMDQDIKILLEMGYLPNAKMHLETLTDAEETTWQRKIQDRAEAQRRAERVGS